MVHSECRGSFWLIGIAKVWSTSEMLLGVGVVELVVVGVCFSSRNKHVTTALVVWLATNFLVYRLGLWWMGWHRPCGCMGSLLSALAPLGTDG